VNKLLRYGVLAACVGSSVGIAAHADPQVEMDKRDPTFMAGPVAITFGGFTELAGIYRQHNEEADVASSYYKIPFPGFGTNFGVSGTTTTGNPELYYEPEFRMSARQSRFSLLAQYAAGPDKLEYYMETDFLSSGVNSNSNESNSYVLRMRNFYADWHHDDWYILAGQNWSLATAYKDGLNPRKENTPMTIDAQYVVGFNWARQAQLRFVQNFGKFAAIGVSLEEPQVNGTDSSTIAGATNVIGGQPGDTGGLLNNDTSYSSDIAPDVVFKVEAQPGFGHYEVYSLTRFMHNRGAGSADKTEANHTRTAESIGASIFLPVVPKMVDLQASGLIGRGSGRYGSGQLIDATVNPYDGSLSPNREEQALFGAVLHPLPRLDLYAYYGLEHQQLNYANGGKAGANLGCDENPVLAAPTAITTNLACSGIVGNERQESFGGWWKAYKGTLGYFSVGLQGSILHNHTLADNSGVVGRTKDDMAFISFRYYPFQN
jgi:hypothetical protein